VGAARIPIIKGSDMQSIAWGKLHTDDTGREVGRLPLTHHCADVAAVAEALLVKGAISRRLAQLAGLDSLPPELIRAFVRAAFLHDLGKCNRGFQAKAIPKADRERRGIFTAGHVREIAPLLNASLALRREALSAAPALRPFICRGRPERLLLLAAVSHHGDPVREGGLLDASFRNATDLWRAGDGYDPMAALRDLTNAMDRWFPQIVPCDLSFIWERPEFVHGLAGVISLADWIGSNPTEGFFPFEGDGNDDRGPFARGRAATVIRRMRIDVDEARADLVCRNPRFEDLFGFAAAKFQTDMGATDFGPVVVVEAETGSGKTEAALWRFVTLFKLGAVDALMFALPTRTAATQIEARVRRFTEALFPDRDLRLNTVLAVPGYIRADGEDAVGLLPGFETLWPDSEDEAAAHRRWAAENPKRFLAAAVVAGTIDQALLSGLATRHAHLRGAALLRALLVVDEVHASDTYMSTLLEGILRRHLHAGGHAVLLSATLGGTTRERLLRAAEQVRFRAPTTEALQSVPYPAISDQARTHPAMTNSGPKAVGAALVPWIDAPDAIAEHAIDAARKGARVLVIRNTVAGATAVQTALEHKAGLGDHHLFRAAGVVAPHHGRFAREDRRLLDTAVEAAFGKDAPREGGLVLIGTQTLEQSLDIDADLILMDLAPIDVLLQRIGRLHRHRRERPPGFEQARVLVMSPERRDLTPLLGGRVRRSRQGLGSVYENLIAIEAAWRLLEAHPTFSIPQGNRALVEEGTDPGMLYELARTLGPPWVKHHGDLVGEGMARGQAASYAALDWSEDWEDVTWLPDLNERAKTRLGLDDRIARFDRRVCSPLGNRLTHMQIAGWLLRGIAVGAEEVAEVRGTDAEGNTQFQFATASFCYGRHGLKREA
jgi:CRISPR-associated endonuclease/helicase Cas3